MFIQYYTKKNTDYTRLQGCDHVAYFMYTAYCLINCRKFQLRLCDLDLQKAK